MKSASVWLLAFALPMAAGAPLLAHPSYRRYGFLCRAALAGGAGAVVLSFVMTVAALVGLPWGVGWLAGVSLCAASLLRLALGWEAEGPWPPDAGSRAAVLSAGALSAGTVAAALYATFAAATASTDLFHFWGPKAQAFAAARTIDAEFLRAAWHGHLHPDYPPLVTNIFAFATLAAGRLPWQAVPYTFPLVLAALAAGLHGILAADRPRRDAHAVAALAVTAAGLLGIAYLAAGNGDALLLFFEACAIALLTGPEAGRGSRLLLAGLFLAGAASAKVEGLVFAVAAAALFFLTAPRERSLRNAVLLLLPLAVSVPAWLAFGWTRQLFRFYAGYGPFAKIHLENLPLILRSIGSELTLAARGLPFLVPLAVLLLCARGRRAILPVGAAAVLLVFFLFTYLHSPDKLAEWITWSAGRIFTPVAVLLALAPSARSSSA